MFNKICIYLYIISYIINDFIHICRWPSYVYNPYKLSKRSDIRKRAVKLIGKEHVVYFYGTSAGSDFGFVKDKDIKPFDCKDTTALAEKQTVTKKYQSQFTAGRELAAQELLLEVCDRVKWKHKQVRRGRNKGGTKKKARVDESGAVHSSTSMEPATATATDDGVNTSKSVVSISKSKSTPTSTAKGDNNETTTVTATTAGVKAKPAKAKAIRESEAEAGPEPEPENDVSSDESSEAEFGEEDRKV